MYHMAVLNLGVHFFENTDQLMQFLEMPQLAK